MRGRQLSFLPRQSLEFGGQNAQPRGRRKQVRPIDPKQPLHVVLRSSRARGEWSMLRPATERRVKALIDASARKHGIRLYRYANVGNHLHLLVRTEATRLGPAKRAFRAFIREITGRIAALVTGSRKSHALAAPGGARFWDFLPYTRIVSWGREFRRLELYFVKNLFEAAGHLTRRAKAAGLRVIPLGRWGP